MNNPKTDGCQISGWHGQVDLVFTHEPEERRGEGGEGTTRFTCQQVKAPLKVQRPFYPEGESVCHSVILHTAGGMVGGDRLGITLTAHPNAHGLVTTAAASKAYRSNGLPVHQSIKMTVGAGGCLEWFPQDLIVFDGADFQQQLKVELAEDAIWMGWEVTRLGRTVRGERFDQGQWRSHLQVWQQGIPLWIDPQWIQGGGEMMTSAHGLAHCPVIGTFAMVGRTMSPDVIERARACWDSLVPEALAQETLPTGDRVTPHVGVSRLQSGFICRYRGNSSIVARRGFIAVWNILRQTYLGRPSCPPRVWPQ